MSDQFSNEPRRGPGRPPNVQREAMRPDNARPGLRERLRGKERDFVTNQNRLEIPDEVRKRFPDVSFEFKRKSCYGQEDPSHMALMRRQGWEPVYAEDVPEMVPEGTSGAMETDGLALMARPQELTDRARAEVKRLSDAQMQAQQLKNGLAPNGHAPRISPQQYGNLKGNPGGIQEQAVRPIPVEE